MKPLGPWVAACLLPLLLAVGCASDEERRAEHLAQAETYLAAGQDREAILELRKALKLAPKDAETNYRIATALERQGSLADALFFYRETTRLDPSHTAAALAEAALLYGEDLERAQELVDGVIAREPDNVLAHVRRSELALLRVDTAAALAAALTATEIDPGSARAHFQVGFVQRSRIREARQAQEAADPELFREAIAAFERSIELAGATDPELATRARLERAEVLAAWPEHREEAVAAYREAVERAAGSEARSAALRATAEYGRRTRDTELQRWALEGRIELSPEDTDAWARLAALTEREGGDPEAVWQRLLALRPASAEAHVRYAEDLVRRDRHPQAIAHLDGAVEQADAPGTVAVALVELLISRARVADARALLARFDASHRDAPGRDLAAAMLALAEGRPDEARELALAEVGRADSVSAQRVLAEAELRRGSTEAAVAAAERALELAGPRPPLELLRLRARTAFGAGDWDGSIRFYQQAFLANRRTWSDNDRLGLSQALYGAGRSEKARAALAPLVERSAPYAPAVLFFARQERGRDPEAVRALLERVLKQEPANVPVLLELVQLDFEQGRAEAGRRRLDALVAANPESAPLLLLRARLLLRYGDPGGAEADARRALELDPQLEVANEVLAGALLTSGRGGQALAELEKSQRESTLSPPGRILMASLLWKLGQPDRAAEVYEQLLGERPDLAAVKNNYAMLLVEQGRDIDRALELAREALELAPDSPLVADTLAMAYLAKGLPEAASSQLDFALELAARSGEEQPTLHYHHGLVLKALGRNEDAARSFERALASGREFPEAEQARQELEALQARVPAAAGAS